MFILSAVLASVIFLFFVRVSYRLYDIFLLFSGSKSIVIN